MEAVDILRWLHVIGATILFGTGAGIAFFMRTAPGTPQPPVVAHVAGTGVAAARVSPPTAVIAQPLTGLGLAYWIGWPLTEGWLLLSIGLYVLAGLFWLPVVWIQLRMRDLARVAADEGMPLPPLYHRLFRIWFACGVPAFLAVLAILWLMLAKPSLAIL